MFAQSLLTFLWKGNPGGGGEISNTNSASTAVMPLEFSNLLNNLDRAVNAVVMKAFEKGISDGQASVGAKTSGGSQADYDPLAIVQRRKKTKASRKRKAAKDEDEDFPEIKGKQDRKRGMRPDGTIHYHVGRSSRTSRCLRCSQCNAIVVARYSKVLKSLQTTARDGRSST